MACNAFISLVPLTQRVYSSFCIPPTTLLMCERHHQSPSPKPTRCSLAPRLSTVTSGIWLAQTARLSMAAFQLGSLVTSAVVQPLYTPQTFASITPPLLAILQAVGFANVGVFYAVRASRDNKRDCFLANAITMAATALVYIAFPVKPPHINVPFVSTLLIVAAVNAASLLRSEETKGKKAQLADVQTASSGAPVAYGLVQLIKFATGGGAFLVGSALFPAFTPSVIGQVYLLQVALNLSVSAALAMRNRVPTTSDIFVLAGTSLCLGRFSPVLGVLSAIGTMASYVAAARARSEEKDPTSQQSCRSLLIP